jgi:hypothetical protein
MENEAGMEFADGSEESHKKKSGWVISTEIQIGYTQTSKQ